MGRGKPKCWSCGGTGHIQTECPSAPGAAGGSSKCCFLCGSAEHVAARCQLQDKDAAARQGHKAKSAGPWVRRVVSSTPPEPCGSSPRMSVLITTSPVPSNPSTMMLEAVLRTFSRVRGLESCPLVIVCDGFKFCEKSTWKAGRITEDAATRYEQYLQNLEELLMTSKLPAGTKLVMLEGHNGQALAVKAGLGNVETPFVCVHQHDLEFTFDFGLDRLLDVLEEPGNGVEYVGMPLLVNLHYEAIAWQHHGVRVQEEVRGGLHLMPIIFWYDSTHITSVRHYMSLIFAPTELYQPGNFVEETFGVRQRQDIMACGMAAHSRYGTYHCLSHSRDGNRRPLICHLNGVRFLTPEQRAARGFPADPPVEFFPSRVMMNRKQRKLKHILDAIAAFAGLSAAEIPRVKDILSKELNETRLRCSASSSQCLEYRELPD